MLWFGTSWAATLVVGDGDYATIASAVNDAASGDTIEIRGGPYTEAITTDKDLTFLDGGGAEWSCPPGDECLDAEGSVSLTGFTMTTHGPTILMGSSLALSEMVISFVGDPGTEAIVIKGRSDGGLTITDSVIDGGGNTSLEFLDTANSDFVSVERSTFVDGGNAFVLRDTVIAVTDSEFTGMLSAVRSDDNVFLHGVLATDCDGVGGGVIDVHGGEVTMEQVTIENPQAEGIWLVECDATIDDLAVSGATRFGRGIGLIGGTGVISRATFTNNRAGAIYSTGGSWEIIDAVAADNSTSYRGGFLYLTTGEVVISNALVQDNQGDAGSGVFVRRAELTILDSVFSDNVGSAVDARDLATVSILSSQFLGNAWGEGAAVKASDSHVVITDSVLSENTGVGAAIHATGDHVELARSIVTNNQGRVGSAFWSDGGEFIVQNSVVAGNTSDQGGSYARFLTGDVSLENSALFDNVGLMETLTADVSVSYSWFDTFLAIEEEIRDALPGTVLEGGDPQFRVWTNDGNSLDDNFYLQRGSFLIDAGDPAELDPDGSVQDIGVYSGPSGDFSGYLDEDADGSIDLYDCDDADGRRFPEAVEACNGFDDDCDEEVDEGLLVTRWLDRDGDGLGGSESSEVCPGTEGYVANQDDLDDRDPGRGSVVDTTEEASEPSEPSVSAKQEAESDASGCSGCQTSTGSWSSALPWLVSRR